LKKSIVFMIFILVFRIALFPAEKMELMKGVIDNYAQFNSISGSIEQHIFNPDGSYHRMSGDYAASGSGLLRIDYYSPSRQIVINNSKGLFWYYPDRDILFVSKNSEKNNESLPAFLKRISVSGGDNISLEYEGRSFYGFFKRAHVYRINLKNGTRIRVWIEPEGRYILRKYVLDSAGREIVKELYSDYIESDGIYIPSVIELHVRTVSGTVRTLTEYKNLRVNDVIKDSLFDFRIKSSMDVRSLDDR